MPKPPRSVSPQREPRARGRHEVGHDVLDRLFVHEFVLVPVVDEPDRIAGEQRTAGIGQFDLDEVDAESGRFGRSVEPPVEVEVEGNLRDGDGVAGREDVGGGGGKEGQAEIAAAGAHGLGGSVEAGAIPLAKGGAEVEAEVLVEQAGGVRRETGLIDDDLAGDGVPGEFGGEDPTDLGAEGLGRRLAAGEHGLEFAGVDADADVALVGEGGGGEDGEQGKCKGRTHGEFLGFG